MSDSRSSRVGRKRVSPARNAIGFVVLIAVAVVGWLEYSANLEYNRAVRALEARTQDENKVLLTAQEVESLLGKSPDGPGRDVQAGDQALTRKTYTWRGLFRSYRLTAFYTKQADARLQRFETEGSQAAPQPNAMK